MLATSEYLSGDVLFGSVHYFLESTTLCSSWVNFGSFVCFPFVSTTLRRATTPQLAFSHTISCLAPCIILNLILTPSPLKMENAQCLCSIQCHIHFLFVCFGEVLSSFYSRAMLFLWSEMVAPLKTRQTDSESL